MLAVACLIAVGRVDWSAAKGDKIDMDPVTVFCPTPYVYLHRTWSYLQLAGKLLRSDVGPPFLLRKVRRC
jgi:hypothetical protein